MPRFAFQIAAANLFLAAFDEQIRQLMATREVATTTVELLEEKKKFQTRVLSKQAYCCAHSRLLLPRFYPEIYLQAYPNQRKTLRRALEREIKACLRWQQFARGTLFACLPKYQCVHANGFETDSGYWHLIHTCALEFDFSPMTFLSKDLANKREISAARSKNELKD